MANFKIITNNPMAALEYPNLCDFFNKSVEGIFISCRDTVHKGAVLINHPLSGSVKPNVSPYKSLVVSDEHHVVDFRSLQLIEDAIATIKKLGIRNNMQYNEAVLEDFQVIDLDLLKSAIESLPPNYYK